VTVETLQTRVIPPTLGYEVPDPDLDLDYVPDEARPLVTGNGRPPVALSNSFAFGGHNVALVIQGVKDDHTKG
jgi:3-oxoacyl-(acyl-carrier-protein) synthase